MAVLDGFSKASEIDHVPFSKVFRTRCGLDQEGTWKQLQKSVYIVNKQAYVRFPIPNIPNKLKAPDSNLILMHLFCAYLH